MARLFISYRRKSWPFTHRLADELRQRLDAEIFVDFEGIDETDFERSILRNLRESNAVLLVVSDLTFEADRIHRDDDWVRHEIREALALNIPLILVCVDGLLPPSGLPDDIKDVARMQGINFYPEFFTPAVERLVEFIGKVGAAHPRAVSESAAPATPASDEKSIGGRATLDEALDLLQVGDFHKAIFLLESLQQAGYASRYVDIAGVLKQALQDAERADRRRQAALDYDEIAAFARRKVTEDHARTAFAAWCLDYPDLIAGLDTENLRARFAPAPAVSPSPTPVKKEPKVKARPPVSSPRLEEEKAEKKVAREVQDILPPPFEWIEIPPGRVTLEGGYGDFEVPAFFIAKYPITNAQYEVFARDPNGYANPRWWNYSPEAKSWRKQNPWPKPGEFAGNKRPRETVCWYDTVAFCRWLSFLTGQDVRLPTEQQWQWAAQGGDGRRYPWGRRYEFDKNKCNTWESEIKQTTDVDHYSQGASPFGVIDMIGNVWEWCLNKYDDPVDTRLTSGARRVVRGGSWSNDQNPARAACRSYLNPDIQSNDVGFRVVRVPQP